MSDTSIIPPTPGGRGDARAVRGGGGGLQSINATVKMCGMDKLTAKQAAARLNVTMQRLRQYRLYEGLPAEQLGRDWFYSVADLDAFKPNVKRAGWPKGKPRKTVEK